jgi:hypothetical protein
VLDEPVLVPARTPTKANTVHTAAESSSAIRKMNVFCPVVGWTSPVRKA